MYHWMLSNPELAHHYGVGRSLHAEAVAQHSYRAVRGIGRLLALPFDVAATVSQHWQAWQRRRQSVAALRRLDDRLLADIGIHRSEIPAVVQATEEAEARGETRRGHHSVQPLRAAEYAKAPIANDNPTPDLARAACG